MPNLRLGVVYIFMLTSAAILLINALELPREANLIRALAVIGAFLVFPLVAAYYNKENRFLLVAFLIWALGSLVWRISSIFAGAERTVLVHLPFLVAFIMLTIVFFMNFDFNKLHFWPIAVSIFAAIYLAFIHNQLPSIAMAYAVLSGFLISFGLLYLLEQPTFFAFGIFMLGVSEVIYLYASQANFYYVSGWVDFTYLLAWFMLALQKEKPFK